MRIVCVFFTDVFVCLGFFDLVEMIFGELSSLSPAGLTISCFAAFFVAGLLKIGRELYK